MDLMNAIMNFEAPLNAGSSLVTAQPVASRVVLNSIKLKLVICYKSGH
jgi:hypothetical protein